VQARQSGKAGERKITSQHKVKRLHAWRAGKRRTDARAHGEYDNIVSSVLWVCRWHVWEVTPACGGPTVEAEVTAHEAEESVPDSAFVLHGVASPAVVRGHLQAVASNVPRQMRQVEQVALRTGGPVRRSGGNIRVIASTLLCSGPSRF
jgi:hypothetical protein